MFKHACLAGVEETPRGNYNPPAAHTLRLTGAVRKRRLKIDALTGQTNKEFGSLTPAVCT